MNEFENLDRDLIQKYNVMGPYYTSYPVVKNWSEETSGSDYRNYLKNSFSSQKEFPLNLYLHFPFCATLCYFCICHTQVTQDKEKIDRFVDYFCREIDMLCKFFDDHQLVPRVKEVHFGGGSPTLMNENQFNRLVSKLQAIVDFKQLDECALEIDVRTITREKMKYFHEKGINRISFGVQDFEHNVQKKINREQPVELFHEILKPQIRQLFKGINFDLIYGMPLQTRKTFHETIEIIKKLSPDRISVYNYFHNPDSYKQQSIFEEWELPSEEEKIRMGVDSAQNLLSSGYERIGIDHYAKSQDSLAIAKRNKTLQRSFMGYTVGRAGNLIGIGPSALSEFGSYYTQNVYTYSEYYQSLDRNEFPVFRGFVLSDDDVLRRDIMHRLLCHFQLDFKSIEETYDIDFTAYFQKELGHLRDLIEDGLIEISDKAIHVTSRGEFFVRHVCMAFDKYLEKQPVYSLAND